jgi:HAD superfamily hydrolase (TIGR01484 family)
MKPTVKLVILDLDGTTVASNGDALPSERVVRAVKAAQEKVQVVVATGRPYDLALPVISRLGLHGPSVFNGGAEIIDVPSKQVIHEQALTRDTVRELVSLSLPFGYKVYSNEDQYATPFTDPADVVEGTAKLFIEAVKTSDAFHLLEELAAVQTVSAHPTTSWESGDVVDIHVTHMFGTKRHGVEKLMEVLHVNKAHTLAIGDSYNDIPLLEAAGFKVAMGNAPAEVKAVADYIAPTLADDGVAETIERFILG